MSTSTLRHTLVDMGLMQKRRRGPAAVRTPEEAKLIKQEQCRAGDQRRRVLINEAKAQGLPPPVFKRGRPRKYTPEEAFEVRKEQCKQGYLLYVQRLKKCSDTWKELGSHEKPLSQFSKPV